jgi:hypothetical protein
VGHGSDLVCSYDACRTSGVKFRYCTSCRIPVAKRTFHQRHSHGIPTVYAEASSKTEAGRSFATPPQSNVKKSASFKNKKRAAKLQPVPPPAKKLKQPFASLKSRNENDNSNNEDINSHIKRPVADVIVQVDQGKQVSEESGGTTDASDTSGAIYTEDRRKSWAALLERRPDSSDGGGMTAWLDEVMSVSNPKNRNPKIKSSSSTRSRSSLKRKARRRSDSPAKKRRDDKKRYSSSSSSRRCLLKHEGRRID